MGLAEGIIDDTYLVITDFTQMCPSIRPCPLFKINNFQVKIVIATGEYEDLAEGIINDTCLVFYFSTFLSFFQICNF